MATLSSSFLSDSNKPVFVIRDIMFKPLTFYPRDDLGTFFTSEYFDVSPWIAIDLGFSRIVDAVQISQKNSTAMSGNVFIYQCIHSFILKVKKKGNIARIGDCHQSLIKILFQP